MSLMGSLYVGNSGLQTGQNALNTTAHNLSNTDTKGFVRQQTLLGDRIYNTIKSGSNKVNEQQVGLGVNYSKVRQVRDFFLDQSYRRESGRSSFYDTTYDAVNEVEDLLDELDDDASFNKALTNLWSSLEELAKTPDDTVVQRLLVQNSQSFLTNASQVYQGLIDYQNETNRQITAKVNEINQLGDKILHLNWQIRSIEVGGIETSNDLRDERNLALDQLASLVNISYEEDTFGAINVKVEGVDFVKTDSLYKMGCVKDSQTGFYTPYWEIYALSADAEDGKNCFRDAEKTDMILDISTARVFDIGEQISSEKNTDVGELRAMMYIRGEKVANYTDIPVKPTIPNQNDYSTVAEYNAAVYQYNQDMNVYDNKVVLYNDTIAQSICMNTQAEFDQLVHNVVTTVNAIMANAFDPVGNYMVDDDGSPLQMFQKIETPGYTLDAATGDWNYVEENTTDKLYIDTLYSIPNLQVNPTLIRNAGKLKFQFPDGTVDYTTAKAFLDAFDANIFVLNPNVTTKCSINTYYTNLVSQVANTGAVYKNISLSQQATVSSIDYSREQVQGVSGDEELNNMIKFQNAYNAASRYITVVDEMLEHLLSSLG